MTRPLAYISSILFLAGCTSNGPVSSSAGDASATAAGTGGIAMMGGATGSRGASASGGVVTMTSGGALGDVAGGAGGDAGGNRGSGGATVLPDAAGENRPSGLDGSANDGATGSGGAATAGGTAGAGGRAVAGGATSSGGVVGPGGTMGTGGAAGTGGARTGGSTAMTGGLSAPGGAKGSGGATSVTGGASGSGTGTTGITCTPQTWPSAPVGWATLSGGTAGGGNATPTVVGTLSALNSAVGGSGAAVVHVSGKIGPGVVTVGSNKTILGLCGAEIDGSIDMTGSSNIIMRNLKIVGYNCTDSPSDCSAGHDAVHVQGGDKHLWFDHLDISDGSDGNLDITHGCDDITISWTKFHYSGARTDPANNYGHRFSNLIGHDDANASEDTGHLNVTFDHVWWTDFVAERMPRVRFGKVHVFNSLYTATGDASAVGVGVSCDIRVENSVFQNITNAADSSHSDSASILQSLGNQGLTTNIGGPAFTPTYNYTLEDVATVATSVQAGAGPK
jgi:pectate lyase